MTAFPLVSVIVPIYKVERYLKDCLDSIVNQTYKNLNIILINDGSPDNCDSICKSYALKDKRIVYFEQDNKGLSAARNLGIANAKGEYYLFIDSDDIIKLDMIYRLVSIITSNNAYIATARMQRFKDGKSIKEKNCKVKIQVRSGRKYSQLMARPMGVFCFACNRLIHRSLFEGYSFPVGLIFEDVYVMPRIVYNCNKVVSTNEALYYYRIRNTSLSHSKFSLKSIQEMDAYINLFSFGEEKKDKRIKFYAALFFVTKYHYYTLKVIANSLGIKEYRAKYKGFAVRCWKYIFSYLLIK